MTPRRSGWARACALIIGVCLTLPLPPAHAQSTFDGVTISSDEMHSDRVKNIIKLKGNVQLVFQGQHLSADEATIDMQKQALAASGHVILSNERVHVEGDRLAFNYKQNTGFIYNGFVQSGQVIFEGDVVEKVGEDHYIASNAFYTACETCPPGWSFSGRKIDAEIGGYARIQRPVFRIGGVPVLVLPSLIVPLKSARQSGLLVPTMSYSGKGGVALAMDYFWAIDRSQDVTFTPKWYRFRGYKALADYRYVLSPDSHGELKSAWMNDRVLQQERRVHGNIDRWFTNYDHIYELPEDYVHRANVRMVSDLRYPRDFPEEILGHGDPALENKMSITKTTDNQYASIEADMYTNLLRTYPLASNQDAVHRVPEVRYALKDRSLGESGFVVGLNLDYVNFARSNYGYDDLCDSSTVNCPATAGHLAPLAPSTGIPGYTGDPATHGEISRDGVFNSGTDLQRSGERLDVQPSIAYPFQIAHKFDILPLITYRETQYRFTPPINEVGEPAFAPTAARRYLETTLLVRTEFTRVFGDLSDLRSTRWKHSIEPQIGYSQIPILRKPQHPFFGAYEGQQYSRQFEPLGEKDLGNPATGVQFDYNDRTYEKRVVQFGLNQRLTKKVWRSLGADYLSVLRFNVAQSYDFNESHRKLHAHPWSPVDALIDARLDRFETYSTFSYNPYARKTNTSARIKTMLDAKTYLQVAYTRNFQLNEDDYSLVQNGETRSYGLGAGFTLPYMEAIGTVDINDVTHKIQAWGYGIRIRPPGNCWVISIDHTLNQGGDPKIQGSLSFDFGGETMPRKM